MANKEFRIKHGLLVESGDVGIGTLAPGDFLDVLGSSTTIDIGADDTAEVVAGFVPDSTNQRNGRLRIAGTNQPHNNSISLISDSSTNVGMSFVTTGSGTKGERLLIDSVGHITPGTDNAQDLGTNSKRWRNVYSADLQLSNVDTGGNDVDGSEGSWTIQEGENDLFIINKLNGKKYKFNLEEVE